MPAVNVDQYITAGFKNAWYSVLELAGSSGLGAANALTAGSDSGAVKIDGVKTLSLRPSDYRTVPVSGDDETLGQFIFAPADAPSGNLVLGTFPSSLAALALGINVWTSEEWESVEMQPSPYVPAPIMLISNSQAQSRDAGSKGVAGFYVTIWYNLTLAPTFNDDLNEATETSNSMTLSASIADTTPWGKALALADEGATESFGRVFWSPFPVTMHTYRSDASATPSFTVDETPAGESQSKMPAWMEGVKEIYTTNYTVVAATKTVTLVGTPTLNDLWITLYQYDENG